MSGEPPYTHLPVFPPNVSERPFALACDIVLDLPVPPSVNRTRKVNWAAHAKTKAWISAADKTLLAQGWQRGGIIGRVELRVTLSEAHTGLDLDNALKGLIDYLRRIEVIEDDSKKYLRRLTVEWGTAPEGARVVVRGCE